MVLSHPGPVLKSVVHFAINDKVDMQGQVSLLNPSGGRNYISELPVLLLGVMVMSGPKLQLRAMSVSLALLQQ